MAIQDEHTDSELWCHPPHVRLRSKKDDKVSEAKGLGKYNDALAVSSKVVHEAAGSATRESYYLEINFVSKVQSAARLQLVEADTYLVVWLLHCINLSHFLVFP
jgi:hypothetical protein